MDDVREPSDRLVIEESPVAPGPGLVVLVVGSVDLAAWALAAGARVLGFCDAADEHQRLPDGVERVTPTQALTPVDVVWARLPRELDALDELCAWVAPVAETLVAGGRTKHMTTSMNQVMGRYFASVEASLGRQKSRVLRATGPRAAAPAGPAGGGPWPRWGRVALEGTDLRVAHHGATFASGRLDPGTRLLLGALDGLPPGARRALDWGSGAGLLTAALANAPARPRRIEAVDLSWAGWAATSATIGANDLGGEQAVGAHWADGNVLLSGLDDLDLVVSNPPFHRGAAKDSTATLTMIDTAAGRLTPGGQLWLVFNSHLPYLTAMRRHGPAEVLARDRAFTVARLEV